MSHAFKTSLHLLLRPHPLTASSITSSSSISHSSFSMVTHLHSWEENSQIAEIRLAMTMSVCRVWKCMPFLKWTASSSISCSLVLGVLGQCMTSCSGERERGGSGRREVHLGSQVFPIKLKWKCYRAAIRPALLYRGRSVGQSRRDRNRSDPTLPLTG